MSSFPSPSKSPTVIPFQFNPEQITRNLSPQAAGQKPDKPGSAREEALKTSGPPLETISLKVVLDASDELEFPEQNLDTLLFGIHPALAALEMLLYPPSTQILLAEQQTGTAVSQISPGADQLPLVLFVWGPNRVAPVRVTSFSVTEDFFDTDLNPIRASVDLGMQVLTYMVLDETSPAHGAYMTYQETKERLARLYASDSAAQTTSVVIPF